MTVEVRELTINATIIQDSEADSGSNKTDNESELNRAEIISACVEQVLKVLENSKER